MSIDPATLSRSREPADFYTIGYSGKGIDEFLRLLREHGVATLVDVRHAPVSRHRPEFSKGRLRDALEREGFAYVHLRELGVPKAVREELGSSGEHDSLFAWYDANVAPRLKEGVLEKLRSTAEPPYAFMCMERDSSQCHRSRIAAALRDMGLTGAEIV